MCPPKVVYEERAALLKSELETCSDISGESFEDVKLYYSLASKYLEIRLGASNREEGGGGVLDPIFQ